MQKHDGKTSSIPGISREFEVVDEPGAPKPRRAKKELPAEGIVVSSSAPKAEAEGEPAEPKKKAGWWQRRLGLG